MRARSWVEDGPAGELVDINGPFESRSEARAYVVDVKERQIAAIPTVARKAA